MPRHAFYGKPIQRFVESGGLISYGAPRKTPSRLAVVALVQQAPASTGYALTASSTPSECQQAGTRPVI